MPCVEGRHQAFTNGNSLAVLVDGGRYRQRCVARSMRVATVWFVGRLVLRIAFQFGWRLIASPASAECFGFAFRPIGASRMRCCYPPNQWLSLASMKKGRDFLRRVCR